MHGVRLSKYFILYSVRGSLHFEEEGEEEEEEEEKKYCLQLLPLRTNFLLLRGQEQEQLQSNYISCIIF